MACPYPARVMISPHDPTLLGSSMATIQSRRPLPPGWRWVRLGQVCGIIAGQSPPGDILISVRAPVGPTNVADVECCIGRGLSAICPRAEVDCDFVLAALKLFEGKLEKLGSASTFGAIKRDDLESLEIPFPSVEE